MAGGASVKAASHETSLGRIIRAAKAEFSRHGLEGARIDTIAKSAGVSQQLVFHYFGNKEALYSETLVVLAREGAAFIRCADFDSMAPLDAIEHIVRAVVSENVIFGAGIIADQIIHSGAQITRKNPVFLDQLDLLNRLEAVLRRGQADGTITGDIRGRELLATIVTMSMGYIAAKATVAVDTDNAADDMVYDEQWWIEFSVRFIRKALRP